MEISQLLLTNYLPYAKYATISRAIPGIDGLKPVQRRALYAMDTMGLGKDTANTMKSVKVIGEVMGKYHPHGDSSIYEAIVLMTTGYNGFNVPYIKSKGSFGVVYSRDLQYSAARYTEIKLAKICNEFFDGIKENAVDFVDNFDNTEKEPTLLPVKFPSILVNSSSGIAVGTSSNIPSFSLNNVCLATQKMLIGEVKTPAQLAEVLGAPEFTTGGFLHANQASLEKLCATGKGSFVISGRVQVYTNQIVIDEIPYCTTAEAIMDSISEHLKDGQLKGITDVRDEIGLGGLRIVVEIKRGFNSRDILRDLCRLTPLRSKISFRTRVIVNNRCRELNLVEVLENWISFRETCIKRVYQFKLDKALEKEHLLSAWEKVRHDILGVVEMISRNTDAVAKQKLVTTYGLSELQAEYLLEMKLRNITTDRADKALKELKEIRDKIKEYGKIVKSLKARKAIIYDELGDIIKKYGIKNKTVIAPELTEEDTKIPEVKISDESVVVVYTRDGYIKRLTSLNNMSTKFESPNGDYEVLRWSIKNNEYLLVFDRFGTVHKILVDDIDSSRGKLVDKLHEKAGLEKAEDLIYADACGDYTGYFNLIYHNGHGVRVHYNRAVGKRAQYKSLYEPVTLGHYWITKENQFFIITGKNKAAYCDLTNLGVISNRTAFKIARIPSGDWIQRLSYYKDVPNKDLINLAKYSKDYPVAIGYDMLWEDKEAIEAARLHRQSVLEEYDRRAKEAEEKEEAERLIEDEKRKARETKYFGSPLDAE